ncbi:CaiB/BaiF CoA transferase family protein [Lysobacter sp. CA199]|uniref:CaiB/BaiF CoA transferase family protein n=1 Tax=Lysobacter sp. CA199 TaxID=3455608 RepID=UPI003F8D51A1
MSNSLLSGVRVLDLTRLLPGPLCTLYLAQLGAEVIKIEHPDGGDYARRLSPELFALVNRGKRSVSLDLTRREDVEAFHRLVESCDAVIESFRPGVMDKLGCGYAALKRINPRLVYAAITGYGQTGPYRDRAGHDMNYCAYAGVLDQLGNGGGLPGLANVQIADIAGGSLTAATGVLAALLGARESGQGCMVDVAMLDGTLALQQIALSTLRERGEVETRGDGMLTGGLPNYRVYRCRDGRHLAVAALEPKFFRALLSALRESAPWPLRWAFGRVDREAESVRLDSAAPAPQRAPSPPLDPQRLKRRLAPLHGVLALILRSRDRDYWLRRLNAVDCCVSPVLTLGEALRDEQVLARGMVEDFRGKPAFACPIRYENASTRSGDTPELGADNEAVLKPPQDVAAAGAAVTSVVRLVPKS